MWVLFRGSTRFSLKPMSLAHLGSIDLSGRPDLDDRTRLHNIKVDASEKAEMGDEACKEMFIGACH